MNEYTGLIYTAKVGSHAGHRVRVLGHDGLWPDDYERFLVACECGYRWGVHRRNLDAMLKEALTISP